MSSGLIIIWLCWALDIKFIKTWLDKLKLVIVGRFKKMLRTSLESGNPNPSYWGNLFIYLFLFDVLILFHLIIYLFTYLLMFILLNQLIKSKCIRNSEVELLNWPRPGPALPDGLARVWTGFGLRKAGPILFWAETGWPESTKSPVSLSSLGLPKEIYTNWAGLDSDFFKPNMFLGWARHILSRSPLS